MSASEYWSKAETLLAEYQFLLPNAGELADELIQAGYVLAADRDTVAEEITTHNAVYSREDFDADCKCGKWLEDNEWEWADHMGDVLDQWITEAGKADRRTAKTERSPEVVEAARNPEQPLLDRISELVDHGEPRPRRYDYCHMCRREWHGLPLGECQGDIAREEAIETFLGDLEGVSREALRRCVDAGVYFGPENFIDALLAGRTPIPFAEDTSLWTVRPITAPGVVPRALSWSPAMTSGTTEAGRADR